MMLLLSVLVSCRQDLCYDHYPAIDLSLGWELEWERDYGMNHFANWNPELHRYQYDELRPSVPEWVKMVRYFDDGRRTERFFSPEGAKFEVGYENESSMLFYNGDTEYIILSDIASLNDLRATATGRTRSGSTAMQAMQELYSASRTINPPDVIYSAFVDRVSGGVSHEVKPLPVKMQPLVYTYLITYEFEKGLEHVALARGALGGMAEGVYLRSGVTTDEPAIILFDCDVHADACRCQVRSFGVPAFPDSYFGKKARAASGPFSLSLEVRLKNGKTTDFYFDVTDQVRNQPRGGVIRVGGIKIEDELAETPPAGFIVDVSDWGDNVEEIDLPLGSFTK